MTSEPPRNSLLGVTPPPHSDEQLRCEDCGLVTGWFHGWSFTAGRPGECQGADANAVTGHHRWVLEPRPC